MTGGLMRAVQCRGHLYEIRHKENRTLFTSPIVDRQPARFGPEANFNLRMCVPPYKPNRTNAVDQAKTPTTSKTNRIGLSKITIPTRTSTMDANVRTSARSRLLNSSSPAVEAVKSAARMKTAATKPTMKKDNVLS